MANDDLPPFVRTSRKTALLHGAAFCELEIRRLRAQATSADGRPWGAQHTVPPSAQAERIMLATLEFAASAAILREMAARED